MNIATEIVTMSLVEGVGNDEFIKIVSGLEREFHSKLQGFVDSELLFNEKSNEWIIIQHWSSLDNMRAASKQMFNNPLTENFVKSLDPKSVKMLMLPQLGTWGCETIF